MRLDDDQHCHSIPPKALESVRRQRGIAGRVLNVAVPQVGLQRSGVVAVVRKSPFGNITTLGRPMSAAAFNQPRDGRRC
jgi:hypothetical protein